MAPVNIISQEEIIRIARVSRHLEDANQIDKLSMNIA